VSITPYILYPINPLSAVLTTAGLMLTSSDGTSAQKGIPSITGHPLGYSEMWSQGTSNAWQSLGALGNPSGNGWLRDATTLEGNQFVAGNWSAKFSLNSTGNGSYGFDAYLRVFKYNSVSALYTAVGVINKKGVTYGSGSGIATHTTGNFAFPAVPFYKNEKIYLDLWYDLTQNSASNNLLLVEGAGSGFGFTGMVLTSPGYQPLPAVSSGSVFHREDRHSRQRMIA